MRFRRDSGWIRVRFRRDSASFAAIRGFSSDESIVNGRDSDIPTYSFIILKGDYGKTGPGEG